MFNVSWKEKTNMQDRTFLSFIPSIKTKYKEIPIRVNKKIQTGAKTQFGGLKNGFWRVAYHPGIEGEVNIDPITPAIWQIAIEIINLVALPNFIVISNP